MKKKRKRNHGRNAVRIVIGVLLIITGVGWYLYPSFRDWKTQREVDAVIAGFERQKEPDPSSVGSTEGPGPADTDVPAQTETPALQKLYSGMREYNENLAKNGQQLSDAWDFEQTHLNMAPLGSEDTAIGYIEIPDMDVRMPLYIGASHSNMAKGAAVLAGTSMPVGGENTNCVICGHRGWRGSAYFRNIEDMKTGSMVYINTPWETLAYKAVSAKIIHSSEVENILIQSGKDMVTLFSCYPYAHSGTPYRYVVYCERADNDNGQCANPEASQKDDEEKEALPMDGIRTEQHIVSIEKTLLFLERTLRYVLPAAVVLIAGVICLVRKKQDGGQKRDNPQKQGGNSPKEQTKKERSNK